MPRFRVPYPPEFRRQTVESVRSGRTPEELSREFEPTAQSISKRVRQAERMNRTIKHATTEALHDPDRDALEAPVLAFVTAYDVARPLKPRRWRDPFQAICDAWADDPCVFRIDPHHLIPGPDT